MLPLQLPAHDLSPMPGQRVVTQLPELEEWDLNLLPPFIHGWQLQDWLELMD